MQAVIPYPMNNSGSSNTHKDGRRLMGLQQAIYVMSCLSRGMDEREVAKSLDGDGELVEVWIDFLCDLDWVRRYDVTEAGNSKGDRGDGNVNRRWLLTDIGKLELAHQEVFGTV